MDKTANRNPTNRRNCNRRRPRTSVKVECRKGAYGLGPNLAVSVLDVSETGARLVLSQAIDLLAEVEAIVGGYGMKTPIKEVAFSALADETGELGSSAPASSFKSRLVYRGTGRTSPSPG